MIISLSAKPTKVDVDKIIAAGPGASVHHPLAANRRSRDRLIAALTKAGLKRRVALTLQWSSSGEPIKEPAPAEPVTASKRRSVASPAAD